MTQKRRRIIFWSLLAILLAGGVILQAWAGGRGALPPRHITPPKSEPESASSASEEMALFQELSCMIAVIAAQIPLAERECGRAIALSPRDSIGYKYRGLAYLVEHRFERAEMDLREAVRLDPGDPDSQAGFAQALSGQGRFTEAVARFGVALEMAPRDVRFLSARCWALAGEGKDFAAALKDCDRAIQLDPRYAVAYDSRGFVYLRSGRDRLAARDYSTALKLTPARATALFGRGMAGLHLGQQSSALADIRAARRADPEVDDIYILAGVEEEGCRTAKGPCNLPDVLRPEGQAGPPYLSVSYRKPAP